MIGKHKDTDYYLIVNPHSGGDKSKQQIVKDFEDAAGRLGARLTVYYTKAKGDAIDYIRRVCKDRTDNKTLRFYGIGGDGTVNELVNGAYGFADVEIGIIPAGTGNDFIRNFGSRDLFLNAEAQIAGQSRPCDLIKYSAQLGDKREDGLCANMFNIGLDCNIVITTEKVKNVPFIGGSLAYLIAVAINIIKKAGVNVRIEYEDGQVADGSILLVSIANGCFCGGGIKGLPLSKTDDGLFDISKINDVSRLDFIRLFPLYKKGTHLDNKLIKNKNILTYKQGERLKVTTNGQAFGLCVDGQVTTCESISFNMIPKAINFIIP